LIPPFNILEGLGETASNKLIEARKISPFVSLDDFRSRSGLNGTSINKMVELELFESFEVIKNDSATQNTIFDLI
jgi:DNA polymerase-3 subunit alpha (Gram-positive type)